MTMLDDGAKFFSLDRDTTVRSWLTADQAETDAAIRHVYAADAILAALGMASHSESRARAIEAAKAAESGYKDIVTVDHWLPVEILNEIHLRMETIDHLARQLTHDLNRQGAVPLSLPVATIRPFNRLALNVPAEDFIMATEDPAYPTYDPREHIAPMDGFEYCIHLAVRARKAFV